MKILLIFYQKILELIIKTYHHGVVALFADETVSHIVGNSYRDNRVGVSEENAIVVFEQVVYTGKESHFIPSEWLHMAVSIPVELLSVEHVDVKGRTCFNNQPFIYIPSYKKWYFNII